MTQVTPPAESDDLVVPASGVPRRIWAPLAAVLVAVGLWWFVHPSELATGARVTEQIKTGETLYVGVLGPEHDGGTRGLHIRDVELEKAGKSKDVTLEALVCHGGSIGTTRNPEPFCERLTPAAGAELRLGGGDQLIVGITAESAQKVSLERARVSYRDGLQFGNQEAGPEIVVTVTD